MAWEDSDTAREAMATPPCRRGALVILVLLAGSLATALKVFGPGKALQMLGFSGFAIGSFMAAVLSPAVVELAYPRLAPRTTGRTRMYLDRFHLAAPYVLAIAAIMLIMRWENSVDEQITAWLNLDFTPTVFGLEGGLVERTQELLRPSDAWPAAQRGLDQAFTLLYTGGFALYHLGSILTLSLGGHRSMMRRFVIAWVGIYAVALPFYVLFPVNEVWTTAVHGGAFHGKLPEYLYGDAVNVMGLRSQASQATSLTVASINNCFPSLHNAFAWALPMLLWRSGHRKAARLLGVFAALITISTVYLGIHWYTDIVAGISLAWFVAWLAARVDYRITHRLELRRIRSETAGASS